MLPGASRVPAGDVILVDVPREAASEILDALEDLGLGDVGSVTVTEVEGAPFRGAQRAEQRGTRQPGRRGAVAPGPGAGGGGLAGVAVVLRVHDRGGGARGDRRDHRLARSSWSGRWSSARSSPRSPQRRPASCSGSWTSPGGRSGCWRRSFTGAVLAVTVLALLARPAGWVTPAMVTHPRPLTGFIWHPDHWSFVVALLAGVAGVISLTAGQGVGPRRRLHLGDDGAGAGQPGARPRSLVAGGGPGLAAAAGDQPGGAGARRSGHALACSGSARGSSSGRRRGSGARR